MRSTSLRNAISTVGDIGLLLIVCPRLNWLSICFARFGNGVKTETEGKRLSSPSVSIRMVTLVGVEN
jgi:hypothetical protein